MGILMNFHLDIVNIKKSIFSGSVKKIQVSGSEGNLGIYPGHTQLLSMIKPGIIYIHDKNNKEKIFYISGGILEVQPSIVSILADTVICAEDLNRQCIVEERRIAEKCMKDRQLKKEKQLYLLTISQAIAKLRVLDILEKSKK